MGHGMTGRSPPEPATDETLVADVRADISPAEAVERRLVALLKGPPLPRSRLPGSPVRRPPA